MGSRLKNWLYRKGWLRCPHRNVEQWRMDIMARTTCLTCGWTDCGPVYGYEDDADQFPTWTKIWPKTT